MTQEEKELALRFFEKAMENNDNLDRSSLYAVQSVKAAKAIYAAIENQCNADDAILEKIIEDKRKANEKRKAEARARKLENNMEHYLVYRSGKSYLGHYCRIHIKVTTLGVQKILSDLFGNSKQSYTGIAVYKINSGDYNRLMHNYRKEGTRYQCRELSCESSDDFLKYIGECESAEKVDLAGCNTGKAKIL